jgi:predicted Zn-dependent protease
MTTIFLHLGKFQPAKWGIFNRRKLGNFQPALTILSDCAKELHRGTATWQYLAQALSRFQEWDSAHAYLLSNRATGVIFKGQWGLHELLSRSAEAVNLQQQRDRLIQHIEDMELVLKDDIGVFLVENQDRRRIRHQE